MRLEFTDVADDGSGEHDGLEEDAYHREDDAVIEHPTEGNEDTEEFVNFGRFLPDRDFIHNGGGNGEKAERTIEGEESDDCNSKEHDGEEDAVT